MIAREIALSRNFAYLFRDVQVKIHTPNADAQRTYCSYREVGNKQRDGHNEQHEEPTKLEREMCAEVRATKDFNLFAGKHEGRGAKMKLAPLVC